MKNEKNFNHVVKLSENTCRRLQEVRERLTGSFIPENTNCWEIIQCGVEQDCEVYQQRTGRHCYLNDHTWCFGEDMGPFHEKIKVCATECPFYRLLNKEIGPTWLQAHRQLAGIIGDDLVLLNDEKLLELRAYILSEIPPQEDSGEHVELIIFQLGSDLFAIDALHTDEIRTLSEITPVPCTPDYILGICTIRGNIYSVMDIRGFFNAEDQPVTENSMFIIVSSKEFHCCVLVDAVLERQTVKKADIKHATTGMKIIEAGYVSGFILYQQKIVTVINWDGFVSQAKLIINEEV